MNYLEIKVKELFEQVLRGEKRVPRISKNEKWYNKFGGTYRCDSLVFSEILIIQFINNSIHILIEINELENERVAIENNKELVRLFREVFKYSEDIKNDKWLIDKVFGEIK